MDLKYLERTSPWDWPEGAANVLLGVLRDAKATEEDRLLAADLAGEFVVINDEMVAALLSILRSREESTEIRATAAIALGPILEHASLEGFEDPDSVGISERTFGEIQESLHKLFLDVEVPKEVRRRILEASVRAPQEWHEAAIREAYSSDDAGWKPTAVFAMQFVRGFEAEILEGLDSPNADIVVEAVTAARNWEVAKAWPRVKAFVRDPGTEKRLRLAAIEAVGSIAPGEAVAVLGDLLSSEDEDIVEAVDEALAMAEATLDDDDEDTEEDEERGPLS